jgi:hypothetical protein
MQKFFIALLLLCLLVFCLSLDVTQQATPAAATPAAANPSSASNDNGQKEVNYGTLSENQEVAETLDAAQVAASALEVDEPITALSENLLEPATAEDHEALEENDRN